MHGLTIVGVGVEAGQMTLEICELLQSGQKIILHTDHIGCAEWLRKNHIEFASLDSLYEDYDDFDIHAEKAAETVIISAGLEDTIYAVYDIRDRSVVKILEKYPKAKVIAGPSIEGSLPAFAKGAVRTYEASEWSTYNLSASESTLIREIDSRSLASEVKLKLMDCYPAEHKVYLRSTNGNIAYLPLFDIDRLKGYDHRTALLVPAVNDLQSLERFGFEDLVKIMNRLQAPDGCAWDKAQTHESLRTYLLEEAYEVIEAISDEDPLHMYEELGDLMMIIVMNAIIAQKHDDFDISDVISSISRKMIQRHSHIFGKDHADNPDEVLDLWAKNKMLERNQDRYTQTLQEVSKSLPALLRAKKIIGKARRTPIELPSGYNYCPELFPDLNDKTDEQIVGKALFEVCDVASRNGIDPEIALNAVIDAYIKEFEKNEELTTE